MTDTPTPSPRMAALDEAERTGPGTVAYRWRWLLDELDQRFPTTPPDRIRSDVGAEELYLAAIDALRAERDAAVAHTTKGQFLDGLPTSTKTTVEQ